MICLIKNKGIIIFKGKVSKFVLRYSLDKGISNYLAEVVQTLHSFAYLIDMVINRSR